MKSCILSPCLCVVAGGVLSFCAAQAATIDPNKPLSESLKPDILYFDFDLEDSGQQASKAEEGLSASVETGKAGLPPVSRPGPNAALGKALEFNYGNRPPFEEENNKFMGNHLKVPDAPALRLMGQSFTMGAWIKLPEDVQLPPSPYKTFLNKGGFNAEYPGWGFRIYQKNEAWIAQVFLAGGDGNLQSVTARLLGLAPGEWHHLAASFDAEKKTAAIWLDGIRIFEGDLPIEVGDSSEWPLLVGERGMSTYSNIPLVMDEVFIVSGVHDFLPVEN